MDRKMLELYTDYVICTEGLRTATGLSALLDGAVSHDAVTRFLSQQEYDSKDLWQVVKPLVRRLERETEKERQKPHPKPEFQGILKVDDTYEEKPYTDESDLVCWHWDHSKGRYIKGINLLSLLVSYGDVSLPVTFEAVRKDQEVVDEKTGKLKKKSSRTLNEIFRQHLQICLQNWIKFRYVVADSWFASVENMRFIRQKKKYFVMAIACNRQAALSESDWKAGRFMRIEDVPIQDGQTMRVWLKGLRFPLLLSRHLFTNEDGKQRTLDLISNDLTLTAAEMKDIYHQRWPIEVYHKSLKSNLGLEKSPTRTERTQKNHIFACICAYAKLEILKQKEGLNHFALKTKLILKATKAALLEFHSLNSGFA